MFFYANIEFPLAPQIKVSVVEADRRGACERQNTLLVAPGVQRMQCLELQGGKLWLLGDPVFKLSEIFNGRLSKAGSGKVDEILYEEIKGHYYWFHIRDGQFQCGSSFGALYPVYYSLREDRALISSSSRAVAGQLASVQMDQRNLLERLLFNYPLLQSTWWKEVTLLEAHRHIDISKSGSRISGAFEISDYFGAGRKHHYSDMDHLVECFDQEAGLFMPDSKFAVSFTGGFDGRTLVAAASKKGNPFHTYSFGSAQSSDLWMPANQAASLGLEHQKILLDEAYLNKHAYNEAYAFVRESEGNGNLGRPHYRYAARELSRKNKYLITGNFGSELFRALHLPGPMMSEALINLFTTSDESWKDDLLARASNFGKTISAKPLDELIADLEVYMEKAKDFSPNQRFYRFIFNELFRKYFGPELVVQAEVISNRTPYLNLAFIRELNQTPWAGVHSRLFEKRRFSRMKGQRFYSAYLSRYDPRLYQMPTNKGYCPADVHDRRRLPLLLAKVIRKKFGPKGFADENSVDEFFRQSAPRLAHEIGKAEIPAKLLQMINEGARATMEGVNPESSIKIFSIALGFAFANKSIKPMAELPDRENAVEA